MLSKAAFPQANISEKITKLIEKKGGKNTLSTEQTLCLQSAEQYQGIDFHLNDSGK